MTSVEDVITACEELIETLARVALGPRWSRPLERMQLATLQQELRGDLTGILSNRARIAGLQDILREDAVLRARGAIPLILDARAPAERDEALKESWAAAATLRRLLLP